MSSADAKSLFLLNIYNVSCVARRLHGTNDIGHHRQRSRAALGLHWSNYMRVLILGSGVIGTSVAYYLARAGHEVEVVDRQPGPGLETSYANAGEVSPGYSAPWAGPGVPMKAIQWLLMQHSPLVIKPMLDPAMWRWGMSMLRNCTEERYRINKGRMVRLAEYSRDCLKELRADIGIQYDDRAKGTLQLFRTQKQLDGTAGDIAILKEYGVPYEVLDRAGYLRQVSLWGQHWRSGTPRGPNHGRSHRCRGVNGRPLCAGLGQLRHPNAGTTGRSRADLPGQGFLDHGADHQR